MNNKYYKIVVVVVITVLTNVKLIVSYRVFPGALHILILIYIKYLVLSTLYPTNTGCLGYYSSIPSSALLSSLP